MRDNKGRFIKGFHYSPRTEFKKGQLPWTTGRTDIIGHWKGKKFSKSHRDNIAKALTGLRKDKARHWKGGEVLQNGYVYVLRPDHIFPYKGRYVRRVRMIMEKHLNRPLKKGEVIHHINGNTTDDRIENLMLFNGTGDHLRYHALQRRLRTIPSVEGSSFNPIVL